MNRSLVKLSQSKTFRKLPYILMAIIFWGLLFVLVIRVDPEIVKSVGLSNSYWPFFVLVFLAISFTVGLLRKSAIKGFVWGLAVTIFLLLRRLGIGHVVNLLLMIGFLAALEYYWYASNSTPKR